MISLRHLAFAIPFLGAALAMAATGCTTDAYCFAECGGGTTASASASGSSSSTGVGGFNGSGSGGGCTFDCTTTSSSSGGMCMPTNMGKEICDGIDNDCNGLVDDGVEVMSDLNNCGGCNSPC